MNEETLLCYEMFLDLPLSDQEKFRERLKKILPEQYILVGIPKGKSTPEMLILGNSNALEFHERNFHGTVICALSSYEFYRRLK